MLECRNTWTLFARNLFHILCSINSLVVTVPLAVLISNNEIRILSRNILQIYRKNNLINLVVICFENDSLIENAT